MADFLPGSAGLLAPLQTWLTDKSVTELLINKPQEVWVEDANGLKQIEVASLTQTHLIRLFQLIANENQQTLNQATPLLSASLTTGERVQLCLPPVSQHPTLSIRKQNVTCLSLSDYQQQGFFDKVNATNADEVNQRLTQYYQQENWIEFIKLAVQNKKNIVVSGGTSSGKTTFLNTCLQLIDANERLLILEDTRELQAPQANRVNLLAFKGNQGINQITMQELIQCCLRLRPDRIVMGEIRGKEMLDFISACSTGHEGSLTSLHANSPELAFARMVQLIKLNNVPSMTDTEILTTIKQVIDIIIQVKKTPSGRKLTAVYFKEV